MNAGVWKEGAVDGFGSWRDYRANGYECNMMMNVRRKFPFRWFDRTIKDSIKSSTRFELDCPLTCIVSLVL